MITKKPWKIHHPHLLVVVATFPENPLLKSQPAAAASLCARARALKMRGRLVPPGGRARGVRALLGASLPAAAVARPSHPESSGRGGAGAGGASLEKFRWRMRLFLLHKEDSRARARQRGGLFLCALGCWPGELCSEVRFGLEIRWLIWICWLGWFWLGVAYVEGVVIGRMIFLAVIIVALASAIYANMSQCSLILNIVAIYPQLL